MVPGRAGHCCAFLKEYLDIAIPKSYERQRQRPRGVRL